MIGLRNRLIHGYDQVDFDSCHMPWNVYEACGNFPLGWGDRIRMFGEE